MAEKWLVGLDTDQVKAYVFATGRLREIQGASAKLDLLNRQEVQEKLTGDGQIVYAGGGSVLATFDDLDEAQAFCSAVESLYPTETCTATISGELMSYDDADNFSAVFKRMARRLQMKKAQGTGPSYLLSQEWWSRCDRCGQYPATESFADADGAQVALCDPCRIKRQALVSATAGAGAGENEPPPAVYPLPTARLVQHAGEEWPRQARLPETLEELGTLSDPANYISLIYADGNGVGQVLESALGSSDDFKVLSHILEEALLAACEEATRPYWPDPGGESVLPFQPVLIGGDDIILLAAAQYAVPIATQLCLTFQEQIEQQTARAKADGELGIDAERIKIGMSAGVVIAKASHPLFALEELAEELLLSAKRLARDIQREVGEPTCTIDYSVITAATARTLAAVRRQEYQIGAEGNWGTARPYPCKALEGLAYPSMQDVMNAIYALRTAKFPLNKLQQWSSLANANTDSNALQITYLLSRLGPEQDIARAEIVENFRLSEGGELFFYDPLAARGNSRSPLPDIAELYDFLPRD